MKLQEWGGGMSKQFKQQVSECRDRLKKLRSRCDSYGIQQYSDVRWEYLNLLEKQEIYWKQRSKSFWLKEGDRNTRFFYRHATTRIKTNALQRIKDKNGEWKENINDIHEVVN